MNRDATSPTSPRRIVIVGGGFGGCYTASKLERLLSPQDQVQVTLVSRENYFLITPLLFEAGSGILEPRHSVVPIRRMLRRTRFIEAEVQGIDLNRQVVLARAFSQEIHELPYDHLVLALGGVTNTKLIAGSELALPFKTLGNAIALRNQVIELFEQADVEKDAGRKAMLLTFVIVGAGLVGVELMGELTEFLENVRGAYPNVSRQELRMELIEAGQRIMPEMDEELSEYAARVLERRGVKIHVGAKVRSIEAQRLILEDGQAIDSATIVLAVGVGPSPLVQSLDLPKDRRGRIVTEPTMRVQNKHNLWALGDCAAIPDSHGGTYPQLAQHALREARTLAHNLARAMKGQEPRPFLYKTKGTLAALGHFQGVGRVYKFRIYGYLAWWTWRTYYLFQMPRFDRRLRIVIDWTVGLFFKNDVVKLDLNNPGRPLEAMPPGLPGEKMNERVA